MVQAGWFRPITLHNKVLRTNFASCISPLNVFTVLVDNRIRWSKLKAIKEVNMFNENVTRSKETVQAYRKRARQLILRFQRETGMSFRGHYVEYYQWLVSLRSGLSNSSWRQYKAASIYVAEILKLRSLHKLLMSAGNLGCKGEPRRLPARERLTSAKKRKSITEREYLRIFMSGQKACKKSYWLARGLGMFVSIYNVGLRPCEFRHAVIDDELDDNGTLKCFLIVKNAKSTNGRSHGETRSISLDHLTASEFNLLSMVLSCSENPKNANGVIVSDERYVRYASRAFSQFTKTLYKRRLSTITLYTARHQFCANLRKNGATPRECGALMGHANDVTNTRSYGKPRCGHPSARSPKALKSEVLRVKCKAKPNPFLNKKCTTKVKCKSIYKKSV